MPYVLTLIIVAAGLLFGAVVLIKLFYRKVEQGYAMIVNTMRADPTVSFTGGIVYPVIHKVEFMDISMKTIEIDRTGGDGLICKDNIRADIKVVFFVRVNKTQEDVMRVAQSIGCARASNSETLKELFSAKFSEALKTVGKSMNFIDLYQERMHFRDEIIRQIGDDLSGYILSDAAIDYLEQTPIGKLDPNNILDAQGIKKITELTAVESVRTNELKRDEEMQIKKKDVEAKETLFELERQEADAGARQQREIASVQAREQAEADKVIAEEHAKAELARMQTEQVLAVQKENVQREKEVAENNRKRAVVVEEERVLRAKELEVVERTREVELQTIEKEKAVEAQKKAIADIIRERIAVERTVAEQEEAIKEVREVSEATRSKKAMVILAEGKAEELAVQDVKAAEAEERRAHFKASESITLAEATLKVAEKEAEAKKREAEGVEAITAATGLAEAKVMQATADANEKQGMVDAKVKMVEADAVAKYGLAEAEALEARLDAEAKGREKQGMADAVVVEAKFQAEARGLREKFEAMKAMSEETRSHEELRLRVDNAHVEALKAIEAQILIAKEQATVLGTAMSRAKIDIVGGEGDYFDRFVRALSVGKGIDAALNKSDTLQVAFKDHLTGQRDFVGDAQSLLAALGTSSAELQNLSAATLLQKLGKLSGEDQKAILGQLLDKHMK